MMTLCQESTLCLPSKATVFGFTCKLFPGSDLKYRLHSQQVGVSGKIQQPASMNTKDHRDTVKLLLHI